MIGPTLRVLSFVVGILACAFANQCVAATIVWDGTTDNNWTNGPQDNSGGGFPANGATGSNWTVDANPAGGLAVPDVGTPTGNMIDYQYTGHNWTINGATISEDVQIKLDGGTLDILDSSVALVPTSATTGAGLSGLNLGQNGAATAATLTNSSLTTGRSNTNGNSLRILNGSLVATNSTIDVTAEPGGGDFDIRNASSASLVDNTVVNVQRDLDLRNDATLEIDATSTVNTGGGLEVLGNAANVSLTGGSLNLGWIRLNSGSEDVQDLMFDFVSGTITLGNANPLRDNSAFEGAFDWIGAPGDGSITHTDLSANNTNLAGKIAQGFFAVDGVRITPSLSNTTDWTDPANIAALNAELQSLAVNGRFLMLTSDGSQQVLTLAVPEPASCLVLALASGCLLVATRRRNG